MVFTVIHYEGVDAKAFRYLASKRSELSILFPIKKML